MVSLDELKTKSDTNISLKEIEPIINVLNNNNLLTYSESVKHYNFIDRSKTDHSEELE